MAAAITTFRISGPHWRGSHPTWTCYYDCSPEVGHSGNDGAWATSLAPMPADRSAIGGVQKQQRAVGTHSVLAQLAHATDEVSALPCAIRRLPRCVFSSASACARAWGSKRSYSDRYL